MPIFCLTVLHCPLLLLFPLCLFSVFLSYITNRYKIFKFFIVFLLFFCILAHDVENNRKGVFYP